MEEERNILRAAVAQYATIDDEIQELNKRLSALRERRSVKEIEIGELLRSPEFSTFNKLSHGNSDIVVKRPNQWSNPWSLSKSAFLRYVSAYRAENIEPSLEGFVYFLTTRYDATRLVDRFALTRTVRG
jgi:hypothetical protein